MDTRPFRHLAIILAATLCYYGLSRQQVSAQTTSPKIDCYPLNGASQQRCEALGCKWVPVHNYGPGFEEPFESHRIVPGWTPKSEIQEPWCYMPDSLTIYKIVSRLGEDTVYLKRDADTVFPDNVDALKVSFKEHGSLLRVRIEAANQKRYEPQIPHLNLTYFDQVQTKSKFEYSIDDAALLVVKRKSNGAVLFETNLSKLMFADKFIQLNSKLSSPLVYGLGEHYAPFLKRTDTYKVYSFWHTDKVELPGGRPSYGSFPFYINLDSDGNQNAHGVYLRNSDAMDIILQPDQSITFRPIGGILDFFIFIGPTPLEVVTQYQHLVGLPDLPPRWSLGFHLCRYGYQTLEKTKQVWQRTVDSGIPFDVQWNDIDNMERHNDFTYDKVRFAGLPEFIEELHQHDMHYMILFDPGLSQEDNYPPYQLGEKMDIFIKDANNKTLVGKVWNDSGKTVFPDFSNNKSIEYWSNLFTEFQKEIKFDGAWIDMNDISNFVAGSINGCPYDNPLEKPPYLPGNRDLQAQSLCLSARHQAGNEYDLHNLYSFYEAIATRKALEAARPGKRPFIISRSSSVGQGHYGGHWSGDVLSSWDYLRWSIPSMIEHSMYGFNMMGADICGFNGNSNPELCARWSTLGAFYTFSRNHNDDVSVDQDPVAMGPTVVEANKNALTKRYSLIPYLYTLIHQANKLGVPAVRSVSFEFFKSDPESLSVENQFMWGSALMISPVVHQDTYTKSTYLPKGRWYESNVILPESGLKVPNWIDSEGEWYKTNHVALTDIPIFYRGGHILATYPHVKQTVAKTVQQPFGLEVALCQHNKAYGELYVDDGDNVDGVYSHLVMMFVNDKLTIKLNKDDYKQSVAFGQVKFYGIALELNTVKANGKQISFTRHEHVLVIDLEGMEVSKDKELVVELVW